MSEEWPSARRIQLQSRPIPTTFTYRLAVYALMLFRSFSIALHLEMIEIGWLWSQRQPCCSLRYEPLWFSSLLNHFELYFLKSATATATKMTEVHTVTDFRDARAWRTYFPSLPPYQMDLCLASQLNHNHPISSAVMWSKKQKCVLCRCAATPSL